MHIERCPVNGYTRLSKIDNNTRLNLTIDRFLELLLPYEARKP